MSYSTNLAQLVANQFERFVTLNRHQLAGQVANLDFWLAQVRHALEAIDVYGVRFVRMHAAQERHVVAHETTEFTPGADYPSKQRASSPRRVADRELQKARRALTEATTRFLARCQRDELISETQFANATASLGNGG